MKSNEIKWNQYILYILLKYTTSYIAMIEIFTFNWNLCILYILWILWIQFEYSQELCHTSFRKPWACIVTDSRTFRFWVQRAYRLKKRSVNTRQTYVSSVSAPFSSHTSTYTALSSHQVLLGLRHMHSQCILHRYQPVSMLITHDGNTKIGDLGLGEEHSISVGVSPTEIEAPKWAAVAREARCTPVCPRL